ncbi:Adenine-specific DNA methylase, N12 class [Lacrimispora sphenoides]|uniref:LPD25 domain-containing protein n=1 Tax=Lacrimispora sphenoides TaxID=29370 RepID=UPI0008C8118D|nr:LPD25 domain-containing protein [Lacrimispora sphenoides]SEU22416.1 Adenine-specific DNA methylase, N12 class [Lacrimispora sphenoides]
MNREISRISKLIDVRKYYNDALNQIRSSEDAWKAFLTSEGKFIHYPFDVQLMIHSQRPGATACASYSQWNAINCVPRKGSKGIPYVDYSKRKPQLQYLFDIADVISRNQSPLPQLWNFPEEKSYVSELTGDNSESSIESKMWNYIKGFIDREETEDLLRELNNDDSAILSKEIDELQDYFHASVAYAVFSRCDLDLDICDRLNEPLLRNNSYSVQNLDCNGLYVINDGIIRFSKPVYQEIREQIKLLENAPINVRVETVPVQTPTDERLEETVYSTERPYGQLKLPIFESEDINKKDLAIERITEPITEEDFPGNWNNPIQADQIPKPLLQTVLKTGGNIQHSKFQIEKFYVGTSALEVASDRAKAIKKEYGQSGSSFKPDDGYEGVYSISTMAKEMELQWKTQGLCYRAKVAWNTVEKTIHSMISADEYITPEERLEYRKEIAFSAAMNNTHGFIKIGGAGDFIEFERKGEIWTNPSAEIMLPETAGEISEDKLEQIAEISYTVDTLSGSKLCVNEIKLKMMQEGLVIYSPDESGSLVQTYSADEFNPEYDLMEAVQSSTSLDFTVEQDITLDYKQVIEVNKDEINIDISSPGNYRIEDLHLNDGGGPKAKFKQNIEAIKVLKTIEADQRSATYEEQAVLAGFVGWGGLAYVFDESKDAWANEYQDLHELLTKNEYLAARASTLNAHYTSPLIIQSIYQALENMGVKRGNILEPACGSGNFFGMLPASMSECQLYGVELDDLTGRIAKQLYPDVNISITGYEKTKYPNNFFDGVVGNVPFGDYKVSDRIYDKYNFSIHDYFIAKGLDQLRPGGVMAVITSSWTMDKKNSSARKYFAERANLIGAIRLPDNAFKANAGTEAVTDILFFQKLDHVPDPNPLWLYVDQNIRDKDPIRVGDIVTTSQYDYSTYRKKEFDARVIEIQQMDNKVFYDLQALDDSQTELRQNDENVTLKERGGMVYSCNRYFIENPHMVLGEFQFVSGPFGERLTCRATDSDLNDKLKAVVNKYIHCEFSNTYVKSDAEAEKTNIISADPQVRNYTYALVNDDIYYRTDSVMVLEQISSKDLSRMKAMIELRDMGYELLDAELNNDSDYSIDAKMSKLNELYDIFVEHFGVIHSKENKKLFSKDVTYSFLCSFEIMDDNNDVSGKAALFSKRVINPKAEITHVDTANEALMMSLSEKGRIVLDYMAGLVGKEKSELVSDLRGVIFKDPDKTGEDEYSGFVTADEYLSGNVKRKLEKAIQSVEQDSQYDINVQYLQQVQPEPLEASQIDVRLGATWIEPEYIEQFLKETFQLQDWRFTDTANKSERLTVSFEKLNGEWNISNKVVGDSILLATTKYGTPRKNGFHILENCLNLRDSKVYDQKWNTEKQRYDSILNKEETATCNQKAEAIKAEFENWIFAEPDRRNYLVHKYNNLYNNNRPRQYDGSHLTFPGMNPEIKLMPHQKNAVARTLYGGNALLAHVVGAGKTYEITASVMEQKRISLCNKAMIVVPNHLTEQWGREFTDLYPSANTLVAKKDDFIPARRREFCSKIATGEYDAVIIGHTQFEKIPLSVERQRYYIDRQIAAIERAIEEQKAESGQSFTVKQLEKTEKRLQAKLEKLNNEGKKDNVITFEQLGIDRLYVDESHSYKNLYLYTKMSNVAGIQQTEAQKSTDMYMKCQYMDEITPGKCGIVFASGTPISNSMTELYTNMRYLQSDLLERYGLENFDAWASTFGNIQTAIELSPEGTNYRAKKRFSSFFNIPELMSLWKEAADVQTADMLDLSVPTATYVNVKLKPTKLQEKMVESLAERADAVRNGDIDPSVDNMLKITNDGRKLALDQRLISPNMPDVPVSKANVCAQKAYEIWEQTKAQRSAQIIFCDLSTPKPDGSFSVYDAIKKKLVELGVPTEEIAFIHDAKTDIQKDKLFKQVRSGEKRFLLGSTFMMGAGTNVQRNLIAEHHLDVPWRPSDIEQREGRIIRQGNENDHVWVFRYITSGTFDAYSWQVIENKQKFISQIMTSKSPVRSCADLDEQSLSYAEVKALATGNPYIKEKMELDISVSQLNRELANHKSNIYRYQDDYTIKYPQEISRLKNLNSGIMKDIELYKSNAPVGDEFSMVIGDKTFTDRTEAGEALIAAANEACILRNTEHQLGTYLGFKITARKGDFSIVPQIIIGGEIKYIFDLSMNAVSNISSITRTFHSLEERVKSNEEKLSAAEKQLEIAKIESEKPFPKEELYKSQIERLQELNALLGISEKEQNETGVIDDSTTIKVEAIKSESSWIAFAAYNPDDHPEEYDIVPDMDTVEFIIVGEENMNEMNNNQSTLDNGPEMVKSAERKQDLENMREFGYELFRIGYPKEHVYFQSLKDENDVIEFEYKDDVKGFVTETKTAMNQYTVEELQAYHAGDYSKINSGSIDEKAVEVAIRQLLDIRQREGRHVRQGDPQIFIDGHVCNIIDEWTWNQDDYIMGQCVDDPTFFYVTVGGQTFEFDSRPNRFDVEDHYIHFLSMRDIDRHEAEYGADGRRAFPHLNDAPHDIVFEQVENLESMLDEKEKGIKYDLVFGSVGNGITVWNQKEPIYSRPEDEVHMVSDYRTLAYISPDGAKVTWYAENLPNVVISSIEVAAEEQREKYNPDILTARGIDVERDLSDLSNDSLSEFLKDKEVTYIVESVERYKNGQIDSGDKFILSTKEFMEPLKAFGDKNDEEHNLYVCIVENENRLIYVINEKQLEHEAKRYLLQLQESETNPIVRIDFSESGMFQDSEYMSFIDAYNRLAGYNKAATEMNILGYHKTYFSICTLKENKVHIYDGRYDIGSDSGSLLEHIQDLAQYGTSEIYKAMMKAQCNQEEYKQWEIEQDKIISEWIPGLQSAVMKQVDKESDIAKYQQEYKNFYMEDRLLEEEKKSLIGPLSLDDKQYIFYQNGNQIRKDVTFKEAALGLLTAKGCGNGREYLLTMKVLDQEIPILRGSNAKLEIPVPEIDKVIDISENSDMKNILGYVIATVKPSVIDPYNDLDLSFEEYAAHEGNNIWQNPAVVYRASDIFVSVYEETALNELNKEFKCYLKPQDILEISERKCLGSKPVTLSKKVETSIESVKSLVETYVAEKPESPQPESVLQPD